MNQPDEFTEGGYFPLTYYVDFLEFLRRYSDAIDVITYDDLPWGDDFNYRLNYPREFARWKSSRKRRGKITVLLQHDVDSRPERAMRIVQQEIDRRMRSCVMIFNQRIDRRHLQKTGEVHYTDYTLDEALLSSAEREAGFLIGYHSNCFEQALWNLEKAQDIFVHDVEQLRSRFRIRFFSPHGGAPSPTGGNNHDVPIPSSLSRDVRWAHNGHGPISLRTFSDGGINSAKRDPNKRDLRDFVASWRPGERYRILTHPQYYSEPWGISPRMMEAAWYRDMLDTYGRGGSAWTGVEIEALR